MMIVAAGRMNRRAEAAQNAGCGSGFKQADVVETAVLECMGEDFWMLATQAKVGASIE
jgi:hypothetical protein